MKKSRRTRFVSLIQLQAPRNYTRVCFRSNGQRAMQYGKREHAAHTIRPPQSAGPRRSETGRDLSTLATCLGPPPSLNRLMYDTNIKQT